ncbi:hypothetical protein C7449_104378 [Mycoplana dimorpha]|uniref:Uncharacterized protein n=1 Tax=Mycoplana dimorpha TaxID=28320 RepID=A0A2T5B8J0_MYCDI|nr:hypothetical protein C7449_104378 [Mycoplana dimorpha]
MPPAADAMVFGLVDRLFAKKSIAAPKGQMRIADSTG